VRCWQVEVAFSGLRANPCVETRRQWSDRAISRTTPTLMGLYRLTALWAEDLLRRGAAPYAAAWYRKDAYTFTMPSPPSGAAYASATLTTRARTTGTCRESLPTASSAWQMRPALRHNAQSRVQNQPQRSMSCTVTLEKTTR
jgi:hypothetical protein